MRAIVTGGASGIGAALVTRLMGEGHEVAVLDLVDAPGATLSVRCDIGEESEVDDSVRRVQDELGGIDAAVLNAAVGGFAPIVDMDVTEWDRVMRVNLRGTFLCLRAVARGMVEQASGGAIVAVTSVSGFTAERGMAHYGASKAAVAQLVRTAARELGPFAVRVNAVAPGTTDTPMFASTARLPGYAGRVARRSALGGLGTPAALADVVTSLLALQWVTGQVLVADGGLTLWSPLDPGQDS
ncbi:MAG: SDR family NAD(P)-dependent oxidoreductase [Acidimicrobiales bacterium]